MKRGKGFTLIELLAIIVMLAVIALITTPIILGIIDDTKKSAFKDNLWSFWWSRIENKFTQIRHEGIQVGLLKLKGENYIG